MTDSQPPTIEKPQGAALIACAGFLYDRVPLAERAKLVTELLKQHAARKAVVVSAQEHERLVAGVAAQIVPGRQAFVQPPKMASVACDTTLSELWRGLEDELRARGVDYVQAILPGEADGAALEHVGMNPIAKLSFLAADVGSDVAPFSVDFETFDESQEARMEALVEKTYAESNDCPAVDGMRDIADVMSGYRGAGAYDPKQWFFVRQDGEDIGCLLLTDHPAANQFELVYMGLVVERRGAGLGRELTAFAKQQTAAAGRSRIHVAVDSENTPAIQTYMRSGFHLIQEQQVLAKTLS